MRPTHHTTQGEETMAASEMGIAVKPEEVNEGHINVEAQFFYQGNQTTDILRKGRIEKVTPAIILLEMEEGGYKSFSKANIAYGTVFLFT